jgi:hypothetical protein
MSREIITATRVAQSIYLLRGHKVMLDYDLAALYGVATKVLNQAVKRNRGRFPEDFMFQLSAEETARLKSQFVTSSSQDAGDKRILKNWSQLVTSSRKHRGATYRPYAFTEQGVAMLSSVLKTARSCSGGRVARNSFVRRSRHGCRYN